MSAKDFIQQTITANKVTIFSRTTCPYCVRVKKLFGDLNVQFTAIELDERSDGDELRNELGNITGARSVPRVFINGQFIGGCDDTFALHSSGNLLPKL